ncbi:hypothetical protein Fcan01_19340 [Folsomia candida]|uniref:Uncharacterized protein n=1 Tax=Folsomia candida TaxID=158441 RepID=A0A226DNF3_FOLCA|nr:hypothetical protein Fcan01_19340 [Folsomia candida]
MWVTVVVLISFNNFATSAANPYIINDCLYHFVNVTGMSTFFHTSNNQHLISNFSHPNSLSWKTFAYTRTLNCNIKILLVDLFSSSLQEDLTVALDHLTTPQSILENPDYIVFYLKTNLNKIPNTFPNFFKTILPLTVTSKFLVVYPTSIFFVNLQDASLERFQSINHVLNRRHTNFKGGPVSVPKLRTSYEYFGVIYGKAVVCELGYKYSSSGLYCLLHTISTILNFTAFDYVFQHDKVPSTPPIAVVRKDGHQVLLGLLNNPKDRLQVVSHFYNVLPFGFVLVIDKTEFEIANPILSFDLTTWLLLLATIVLISIFIWLEDEIICNSIQKLGFKDLPLLTVSSTLTEQSLSIRLWKNNQSSLRFSKYLLLVWFVASIVLIGGFRSAFYRFLTSSVPPKDVPSTLEELMKSKYTMVGSDSFLIKMNSGPAINILEYILNSYLASSEDEEENEDDNEGNQSQRVSKTSTREIQRKTTFAKGLRKLIFLNKIAYSKLRVLHNYSLAVPPCCTNKPGVILSKSFAMVSSTDGTTHFHNQMKSAGDKYFLIVSKEFYYFLSTTELFAVTSNFFAKPFRRTQSLLIQSGLFQIWTKYGREMMLNLDMHYGSCLVDVYLNDNATNFWGYTTCLLGRKKDGGTQLAQNLQDKITRPVVPKTYKTFRSLSLRVVSLIFFTFGVGMILALCEFWFEWFNSLCKKKKMSRNLLLFNR